MVKHCSVDCHADVQKLTCMDVNFAYGDLSV